jgi:hypothetical protein
MKPSKAFRFAADLNARSPSFESLFGEQILGVSGVQVDTITELGVVCKLTLKLAEVRQTFESWKAICGRADASIIKDEHVEEHCNAKTSEMRYAKIPAADGQAFWGTVLADQVCKGELGHYWGRLGGEIGDISKIPPAMLKKKTVF